MATKKAQPQNIFALIEKDPAQAAVSQIRAHLLIVLVQKVRNDTRTRGAIARKLKIKAKQLTTLMSGDSSEFCLDQLFILNHRLGVSLVSTMRKQPGDKSENALMDLKVDVLS